MVVVVKCHRGLCYVRSVVVTMEGNFHSELPLLPKLVENDAAND